MAETMLSRARAIEGQLVAWRRDFHAHPELGFAENRSAAVIARSLGDLGYRVQTGVARTGVIAELGQGEPVVALRADMDALPIQEESGASYTSQVAGVMHACGHDAHMAIALGAAALLQREPFAGRLRFLFQPAEEVGDAEGLSGAPRMIAAGAMDGVSAALALHVDASLPVGAIALDAGPSSAGVDTLYAAILGEGGHGAAPHKVIDPVYLAAHVILALHGIVSRRIHPHEPAVISIGSIHAGDANNVIPSRVDLTGTIRYMTPEVQKLIHAEIERALQVARSLGGDYSMQIEVGYPPMYNNPQVVAVLQEVIAQVLDPEHISVPQPSMGAEDFGYFSNLAPGAMFYLGCRIEGDERRHHSPRFDIDEGCLPIGAAIMAEGALRLLAGGLQPKPTPPAARRTAGATSDPAAPPAPH
jgi:amidohydrolase